MAGFSHTGTADLVKGALLKAATSLRLFWAIGTTEISSRAERLPAAVQLTTGIDLPGETPA
jgi:hypothetical protein